MTLPASTESLRILQELDKFEQPAWLRLSEELQIEVIDRLRELKSDGILFSALQLHTWLQELAKSAFQVLELGIVTDPPARRTGLTIRDLYRAVEGDYESKHRKDVKQLKQRWAKHLEPVFGEKLASEVRPESICLYSEHRREQGAMAGTINRELSILKRCFKLGIIMGRLKFVPYIGMEREENVRTGFLRDDQYAALATETEKVGTRLCAIFELGYVFGWRRGELLSLRVSQIDMEEGTITLLPHQSKNREGRQVFMTDRVVELLRQCVEGKGPEDFVFTRSAFEGGCISLNDHGPSKSKFWKLKYRDAEGKLVQKSSELTDEAEARKLLHSLTHEVNRTVPGRRVQEFRDEWDMATKAAGVPGLLFHDLRRTASRNLIRAGVSEKVAMTITGHKTASVFKRYQIVSEADLKDASSKLQVAAAERQKTKGAA